MPSSNFSSSLAMAEGRPSTFAMPSPARVTVPTSSREAASGLYDWTKFSSASRILLRPDRELRHLGSLLSLVGPEVSLWGSGGDPRNPLHGPTRAVSTYCCSRMLSKDRTFSKDRYIELLRARHAAGGLVEPVREGAVDDLVTDLHPDAADDRGVDVEVQVHPTPVELGQSGAEAPLLPVASAAPPRVTTATMRSRRSAASLDRDPVPSPGYVHAARSRGASPDARWPAWPARRGAGSAAQPWPSCRRHGR